MDSTLKSKKNAAADLDLNQMMPKDTTVVEVDMEEPQKAKAGSWKPRTSFAGVSKYGRPVQAAMEVGLGKVEDQSGKVNAGTEESEAGTGKTEAEKAWWMQLRANV